MAVMAVQSRDERKREMIPLRQFGFWSEYRDHTTFRVSVIGRGDKAPFVFEVSAFGNMVSQVRNFAECQSMPGEVARGMADIYRTGYGLVNGFNVRVTPLS